MPKKKVNSPQKKQSLIKKKPRRIKPPEYINHRGKRYERMSWDESKHQAEVTKNYHLLDMEKYYLGHIKKQSNGKFAFYLHEKYPNM